MSYELVLIEHDPRRVRGASSLAAEFGLPDKFDLMIIGMTMPVDMDELRGRVEALLGRSFPAGRSEISTYEFGGMKVDFRKSEVRMDGATLELSERESRLLQFFVENRGKIISRRALLHQVWGYPREPLTRTLDVHILRLRRKLEKDPKHPEFIITVHGLGYRFDG